MENYKYIDISKLPEEAFGNINNIIALDANGEVIKAEKEDTYSKEEIDELISNTEVSADNLKNKIKINSASSDYVVTQPTISGDNLVITDAMSDKNQFHTFGFDKTYSTTTYGLLDYRTPLFRGTNEYNCPQWDGNTISYIYQPETEVYPTLTIPYTCNGNKYVTHIVIMIYRENVKIEEYSPINDPDFPDYQIVPFTQSEIYYAYGAYGTLNVRVDGVNQMYENDIKTSWGFHSDVYPSQNVEITVTNFPLEFSYRTAEGTVEGTIETPRFFITSNTVLYGDIPTENETSNAPERLNDYIRYSNDEKAYILTDMNYQNVIKNKDVKINSANTDYNVTQPTVSGDNIIITDVVSDKNQFHTFGFDKTTKGTVFVPKYINIIRDYNGVPSMDTNVEDGVEFEVHNDGSGVYATMWGNIPFTLDKITEVTNILHYEVTYVERDDNDIIIGGVNPSIVDVTYDPNTKLLSTPLDGFSFAQIIRTDTGTYLFGGGTDGSEYFEDGRWYYNFEQNPLEEGESLIWMPYYSSNLFWNYSVTINNIFSSEGDVTTDDKPFLLNDYIRYKNDKAYILTDMNYQNVIKEWVGTQEEYDALETIDNNTTYYITE